MWGAIVALRGRYPEQLEALKDKWWTDESTVETLGALAVWRAELDETRQDPRDEIAFQTQLNDYAQLLRQRAAASPRHGSPAQPRQSGQGSSPDRLLRSVFAPLPPRWVAMGSFATLQPSPEALIASPTVAGGRSRTAPRPCQV